MKGRDRAMCAGMIFAPIVLLFLICIAVYQIISAGICTKNCNQYIYDNVSGYVGNYPRSSTNFYVPLIVTAILLLSLLPIGIGIAVTWFRRPDFKKPLVTIMIVYTVVFFACFIWFAVTHMIFWSYWDGISLTLKNREIFICGFERGSYPGCIKSDKSRVSGKLSCLYYAEEIAIVLFIVLLFIVALTTIINLVRCCMYRKRSVVSTINRFLDHESKQPKSTGTTTTTTATEVRGVPTRSECQATQTVTDSDEVIVIANSTNSVSSRSEESEEREEEVDVDVDVEVKVGVGMGVEAGDCSEESNSADVSA